MFMTFKIMLIFRCDVLSHSLKVIRPIKPYSSSSYQPGMDHNTHELGIVTIVLRKIDKNSQIRRNYIYINKKKEITDQ